MRKLQRPGRDVKFRGGERWMCDEWCKFKISSSIKSAVKETHKTALLWRLQVVRRLERQQKWRKTSQRDRIYFGILWREKEREIGAKSGRYSFGLTISVTHLTRSSNLKKKKKKTSPPLHQKIRNSGRGKQKNWARERRGGGGKGTGGSNGWEIRDFTAIWTISNRKLDLEEPQVHWVDSRVCGCRGTNREPFVSQIEAFLSRMLSQVAATLSTAVMGFARCRDSPEPRWSDVLRYANSFTVLWRHPWPFSQSNRRSTRTWKSTSRSCITGKMVSRRICRVFYHPADDIYFGVNLVRFDWWPILNADVFARYVRVSLLAFFQRFNEFKFK